MARWYAMDSQVEQHPKFLELREQLGWKPCEVLYLLHRIWSYARERRPDGRLHGEDWERLLVFAMVERDRRNEVWDALHACNWLDRDEISDFVVGWMDWNGQWLREAQRLSAYRGRTRTHEDRTRTVGVRTRSVGVEKEKDPRQESKEKTHTRRRRSAPPESAAFVEFYEINYLRKEARPEAWKAFQRALERHADKGYTSEHLNQAARGFAAQFLASGKELQYCPMPATWLNQDRFREFFDEDDPPGGDYATVQANGHEGRNGEHPE